LIYVELRQSRLSSVQPSDYEFCIQGASVEHCCNENCNLPQNYSVLITTFCKTIEYWPPGL